MTNTTLDKIISDAKSAIKGKSKKDIDILQAKRLFVALFLKHLMQYHQDKELDFVKLYGISFWNQEGPCFSFSERMLRLDLNSQQFINVNDAEKEAFIKLAYTKSERVSDFYTEQLLLPFTLKLVCELAICVIISATLASMLLPGTAGMVAAFMGGALIGLAVLAFVRLPSVRQALTDEELKEIFPNQAERISQDAASEENRLNTSAFDTGHTLFSPLYRCFSNQPNEAAVADQIELNAF
ncbi:MAG: hypothetical protein QNK11_03870 [Legionella sp.]|nr:hypothetical protein [Legionella sp.]